MPPANPDFVTGPVVSDLLYPERLTHLPDAGPSHGANLLANPTLDLAAAWRPGGRSSTTGYSRPPSMLGSAGWRTCWTPTTRNTAERTPGTSDRTRREQSSAARAMAWTTPPTRLGPMSNTANLERLSPASAAQGPASTGTAQASAAVRQCGSAAQSAATPLP